MKMPFVALALLALAVGCAETNVDPNAPVTASSEFVDGTPAIPQSQLLAAGFAELGRAYVRDTYECEPQTGFVDAGGFILLKNQSTGEKALCCINARSTASMQNAACRAVDPDFALGPDVFNDEIIQ
ncbi:MAG: hypothetical protein AAGA71_13700 [Pseudomonadota bacterium]